MPCFRNNWSRNRYYLLCKVVDLHHIRPCNQVLHRTNIGLKYIFRQEDIGMVRMPYILFLEIMRNSWVNFGSKSKKCQSEIQEWKWKMIACEYPFNLFFHKILMEDYVNFVLACQKLLLQLIWFMIVLRLHYFSTHSWNVTLLVSRKNQFFTE